MTNGNKVSNIKAEMVILRESFQQLNDSMRTMLAVMPESERETMLLYWRLTTENFEELFRKYLK